MGVNPDDVVELGEAGEPAPELLVEELRFRNRVLEKRLHIVSKALEEITQTSKLRTDELYDSAGSMKWSQERAQHFLDMAIGWAKEDEL